MKNRIIVCGTRTFNDDELLYSKLDEITKDMTDVEIISGACEGADNIGEKYAKDKGLLLKVFPANWDKYGAAAGPLRNEQMLNYALQEKALVVAFWNGKSRGTSNMIKIAKNSGVTVYTYIYECNRG